MAEQIPFGTDVHLPPEEINPEPRCACVLLLDVSRSMAGTRIAQLNEALRTYRSELAADTQAAHRVEVAIVTFGGQVETVCPFVTVEHFQPPTLKVHGDTPMGAAIVHGIEMIAQRKQFYKQKGLDYFRPWLFLFTDGGPTDDWQQAREQVRRGVEDKAFAFFAVGVEGAKFDVLRQLSHNRVPLCLKENRFREMFIWLSRSQKTVSTTNPGKEDGVVFPNPADWMRM
jgi:uncharacterized protein YegL